MKLETLTLKIIIKELDFLKQLLFKKTSEKTHLQFFAAKLTDPCSSKEHYQPFQEKKHTKPVKQSKVITEQPKSFKNSNIIDIKSIIIEHSKTSHKLSKTIRQKRFLGWF